MSFSRREFLQVMGAAAVAGLVPGTLRASQHSSTNPYDFAKFGNVSLMHYTDCHAQLNPIYFGNLTSILASLTCMAIHLI